MKSLIVTTIIPPRVSLVLSYVERSQVCEQWELSVNPDQSMIPKPRSTMKSTLGEKLSPNQLC